MPEPRTPRVTLIPWDYNSLEHVDRMYIQRLACGWRSEEVREKWVNLCHQKMKTLFWVVFRDDYPQRDDLIAEYTTTNPKEALPLTDTARTTHHGQPRHPGTTTQPIHPIGHVALDLRPAQTAQLHLSSPEPYPGSVVWVAGLYIAPLFQARGLGVETMHLVERLAAAATTPSPPAEWMVLDTMTREQQMSKRLQQRLYVDQGKPVPSVATQDWYERMGYEAFAREVGGYEWVDPVTGATEEIDYLFLKKRIGGL